MKHTEKTAAVLEGSHEMVENCGLTPGELNPVMLLQERLELMKEYTWLCEKYQKILQSFVDHRQGETLVSLVKLLERMAAIAVQDLEILNQVKKLNSALNTQIENFKIQ